MVAEPRIERADSGTPGTGSFLRSDELNDLFDDWHSLTSHDDSIDGPLLAGIVPVEEEPYTGPLRTDPRWTARMREHLADLDRRYSQLMSPDGCDLMSPASILEYMTRPHTPTAPPFHEWRPGAPLHQTGYGIPTDPLFAPLSPQPYYQFREPLWISPIHRPRVGHNLTTQWFLASRSGV